MAKYQGKFLAPTVRKKRRIPYKLLIVLLSILLMLSLCMLVLPFLLPV